MNAVMPGFPASISIAFSFSYKQRQKLISLLKFSSELWGCFILKNLCFRKFVKQVDYA